MLPYSKITQVQAASFKLYTHFSNFWSLFFGDASIGGAIKMSLSIILPCKKVIVMSIGFNDQFLLEIIARIIFKHSLLAVGESRGRNNGNIFWPDKFTNLLQSVYPWGMSITEIMELLDHQKMAFLHLNGKLSLLEETSKWN